MAFALGIDGAVFDGDGGDGESEHVRLADFSLLDVQFDDTESATEVCILSVDDDVIDGFVARQCLLVDVADVGDVAADVYKVDIGVLIDDDESLGLFTPSDDGDVCVAEAFDFVVSIDAVVLQIILVECI